MAASIEKLQTLLGPIIARSLAIAGDMLVLILTWMKTASTWKASLDWDTKPSLTTLLVRDGKLLILECHFTLMKLSAFKGTLYFA